MIVHTNIPSSVASESPTNIFVYQKKGSREMPGKCPSSADRNRASNLKG